MTQKAEKILAHLLHNGLEVSYPGTVGSGLFYTLVYLIFHEKTIVGRYSIVCVAMKAFKSTYQTLLVCFIL